MGFLMVLRAGFFEYGHEKFDQAAPRAGFTMIYCVTTILAPSWIYASASPLPRGLGQRKFRPLKSWMIDKYIPSTMRSFSSTFILLSYFHERAFWQ